MAPGATVTGAHLFIYVTSYSPFDDSGWTAWYKDGGNMVGGSGDISGGGGTAMFSPAIGWLGLDVTSAVQNDYLQGYTRGSFIISPAGSGYGSSSMAFDSALSNGGEFGPYLEITTAGDAVPEPGSAVLVMLGLLSGPAVWRRRRTARG
jgi:hypothetical protein